MKTLFRILLCMIMVSCKVNEKPEFKAVENITVKDINGSTVTISAEALYFNPNHIGGTIKKVDLDLFMDGIKISDVEAQPFEINSQENFRIPLTAKVPHSKLFGKSGKQLLGNLINAALNNTVKVSYKGIITLDLGALDYDYTLDETLELNLR